MLEISNKRSLENPQMQIKQNTLLNNPWIEEEITGIRKYCKLNENEDVLYQTLRAAAAKAMLRNL